MKEPKLVRVEWIDAAGAASWVELDQVEGLKAITPVVCVGFIAKQTKDGIYLIMGYTSGISVDEGLQPFFIPAGMIRKIRHIKL
jgi:hypothetical protein